MLFRPSRVRRVTAFPSFLLGVVIASAQSPATPAPKREVIWNNPPEKPSALVSHHELASQAMQRTVGYTLYLPPGYTDAADRDFPVVYFLHGAGGNENADGPAFAGIVDRLIRADRVPAVICVFPNGGMSGYRDHPESGINVETMLIEDLIPTIDATYRTQARREARVIGGYSMGGGGAIRLALTHPDLFSAAASWAGAVVDFRSGEIPRELSVDKLRDQSPTVRVLMITGYDDEVTHRGHWPFVELLRDAKYPFTLRTLRGVPHNLGRYYELTGEEFALFLLGELK